MTNTIKRIIPVLVSAALVAMCFIAVEKSDWAYAAIPTPTSMSFVPKEPPSAYPASSEWTIFEEGDKIYVDYAGSPSVKYTYQYKKKDDTYYFYNDNGVSIDSAADGLSLQVNWRDDVEKAVGKQYKIVFTLWDHDYKRAEPYCTTDVMVTILKDPNDAKSIDIGGISYYVNYGETKACVTDSKYTITKANIKDKVTIDGRKYKVTCIDYDAFADREKLTSVTIPGSITEIRSNAFLNTGLKEITVPASVKRIGSHAIGYTATWYANAYYDGGTYIGFTPVKGFVINGKKGSAAQRYAKENGIKFVDMDAPAKKAARKAKTKVKARALKKGKAKVTWKKVKKVSGYAVYRATRKNGKYKKIKTIKKAKTVKLTVKKLKAGKKYFFKVRPFTKVSGKTYYGKWSNIAKIKAKK